MVEPRVDSPPLPLRRIFDATAAVYLFWATHEIADKGIAYAAFLVPYAGYLLYILVRSIYSERQAMPTDLAKVIFGQIYVGGFLSIAEYLLHRHRYLDHPPHDLRLDLGQRYGRLSGGLDPRTS